MKELFTNNEQNTLLLGASALFTYLHVPAAFIGLLGVVMLADFLTGIAKEVRIKGYSSLSINVFWVGLFKKMTLIVILMMFGLIVLAAKVTALNYPDSSRVREFLELIDADYAVIFAFWTIFLNEILSVMYNAKMITTGKVCSKINVIGLLGLRVENMLYKIFPFDRRELERDDKNERGHNVVE